MTTTPPKNKLPNTESDALTANLRETAVGQVTIHPRHEPLMAVVATYSGIAKILNRLLLELNHPFRNWKLILPELRGFALKNIARYARHETGVHCFELLGELFLKAMDEARNDHDRRAALEALTAYLEKLVQTLEATEMAPFAPAFDVIFTTLSRLPDDQLILLSQTHHPLKRTVALALKKCKNGNHPLPFSAEVVQQLAFRALETTYDYWLSQDDPDGVCTEGIASCGEISHEVIAKARAELKQLANEPPCVTVIEKLTTLPSFMDIVRQYRLAAEQIGQVTGKSEAEETLIRSASLIENQKLRFLFQIMKVDGLAMIHEETLREINRGLVRLIRVQQNYDEIHDAFVTAFVYLKSNVATYPTTALQCIEALGSEVFNRDNNRLVESFLEQVVLFGFQYSSVSGVGADWQPICNPAHLFNIRVWLRLITKNPTWSPTLFSALIINLKLTGALIRDTDLFQKEVTNLLNSGIRPVYNLTKQFCRQLPVYYNEIGAEGELRTVSTELDEISLRKDRLVHFLRKQCHVESTNRIVQLSHSVLNFWRTRNREVLNGLVADAVLSEVPASGPYFDSVHAIVRGLYNDQELDFDPMAHPVAKVQEKIRAYVDYPEHERDRVDLLIQLCHLLDLKYNLGTRGIRQPLSQAVEAGIPKMAELMEVLDRGVVGKERLEALLDAMESLQETILSDEVFPAREEIYQKRHIAVDIPSVYGYYQERKFDALSLSFRLENLANVDLEGLIDHIPEDFITRSAFFQVFEYMNLFLRALAIDGVTSRKLTNMRQVLQRFLELNHFSYHQYLDIFRTFSDGLKNIILTHYTTHHRNNLAIIIPMVPKEVLLPKFATLRDDDDVTSVERIGESFLRDMIAETFGLQAFDRFIARILQLLARQQENMPADRLDQLMTYDPSKVFCPIFDPPEKVRNLIHLGNKGYNLTELYKNKLMVPAGTILTTEFFRCRQTIWEYAPATHDFMIRLQEQIKLIEHRTGQEFGSETHPLLVSVRSGALISMPGMMQTIHNVGLNEKIVESLANYSGNAYFAWDNYRRFVQSWCMTFEADRSVFSDLMHYAKRKAGIKKKREFNAAQMEELARQYRKAADDLKIPIPDNPWHQLIEAINQVVQSWESSKAIEFREIMDISDDWGTAVVVQRMVYGNLHSQSGSGVYFTAHPHRKLDRVLLWGDYTAGNQGEDIVGGLVSTNPISLEQCDYDGRDPKTSLELCFPQVYEKLREGALQLVEKSRWSSQEIEFTFDGPTGDNLFFLQSRDMTTSKNRQSIFHSFVDSTDLQESRMVQGIGVSGGALTGVAVFNMEQVQKMRREQPDLPLILIRYDTVPDDIKEISMANGLLTARGGQTSHAAIVAARLEKVCVVGCENLIIREGAGTCEAEGMVVRFGDYISIDGNRGSVFQGKHEIETILLSR